MMPTVETNLETVRNPTEFIRGRMSVLGSWPAGKLNATASAMLSVFIEKNKK